MEPRTTRETDGVRVAVIVPAYNEQDRLRDVVAACQGSRLADEIVVVSDGSKDRTAEVAASIPGIRVVELRTNIG
ncbi:MAG: glycosyltransferase, partial [Lysobacteraceae bacterium]